MIKMFLFLCFGLVLVISVNSKLPPYIKVCNKNDPNLSQCIIDSIEHLRPKLKEGIPELNIPSYEPLPLSEIKLKSGPNQAHIKANISNLLVHGPSTFKILDLKPDLAKTRFLVQFTVPILYFVGEYDIDMNIFFIKYKGQGPITGNFTNYIFDCRLKGTKITKGNNTYLHFRKFAITLIPGTSELHLGNLFGENGAILRQAAQELVRENANVFVDEIRPALEESLSQKFTNIANGITGSFSYDELFPEM